MPVIILAGWVTSVLRLFHLPSFIHLIRRTSRLKGSALQGRAPAMTAGTGELKRRPCILEAIHASIALGYPSQGLESLLPAGKVDGDALTRYRLHNTIRTLLMHVNDMLASLRPLCPSLADHPPLIADAELHINRRTRHTSWLGHYSSCISPLIFSLFHILYLRLISCVS